MRRAEELPLPEIEAWFLGAGERWPEIFPVDQLTETWGRAYGRTQEPVELVGLLRNHLLRRAALAAKNCTGCELSKNRLAAGAIFDDGEMSFDPWGQGDLYPNAPVQAKVMVVGEAPRQYDQRCGQPLVSFHVLAGSFCARKCSHYELCYDATTGKPLRACDAGAKNAQGQPLADVGRNLVRDFYEALPTDMAPAERLAAAVARATEVARARAQRPYVRLGTEGQLLDDILLSSVPWAWRESWNGRLQFLNVKRRPRPGTLYLTNVVKCRSAKPNPERDGKLKDCEPTAAEVEACRRFLDLQIYVVQPLVIVALGRPAVRTLTNPAKAWGIQKDRGEVLRGPFGIPVIPELHPAWALHAETNGRPSAVDQYKQWLPQTFEKARQLAEREVDVPWQAELAPAGAVLPETPIVAGAPQCDRSVNPLAQTWIESYPPDYDGERMRSPDPLPDPNALPLLLEDDGDPEDADGEPVGAANLGE